MSIEKCKPSFEIGATLIQRAPFTQLYNKVIQNCTNMEAIAVWAYLQSQADNWQLNPVQLKTHFGVSKDKIYKILNFMMRANLLIRHVQRNTNGAHICTHYTVLDGMDYVEPERIVNKNALLPENQDPVNQEPENQDIKKEIGLKKKESKKEISFINSASDDAQEKIDSFFEEFWEVYPVKKNKTRSKKIWDKNKYDKIAYFIINDVSIRLLKDVQWQNKQYIPHPSTYLNNKLWEDDITEFSNIKKPTGKNSSWSNYQQGVEKQSGGNVYEHCSTPQ